jgi:hypothetical protein
MNPSWLRIRAPGMSAQNMAVMVAIGAVVYFTKFDRETKELRAESKSLDLESKSHHKSQ